MLPGGTMSPCGRPLAQGLSGKDTPHPDPGSTASLSRAPRAPGAMHADMTRIQPHGGRPQPHKGGSTCEGAQAWCRAGSSEVRGMS